MIYDISIYPTNVENRYGLEDGFKVSRFVCRMPVSFAVSDKRFSLAAASGLRGGAVMKMPDTPERAAIRMQHTPYGLSSLAVFFEGSSPRLLTVRDQNRFSWLFYWHPFLFTGNLTMPNQ